MKVTIDRFEGDIAVCETEDLKSIELNKSDLPKGAKIGDVLDVDGDTITIDRGETEKRKKDIEGLMDDLFE